MTTVQAIKAISPTRRGHDPAICSSRPVALFARLDASAWATITLS
jgi:hypothetical protein